MNRIRGCLMGISLCAAVLAGCNGPRIYKVKLDVARQTLTKVLDHWKSGATPESLRTVKPEIVVQDPEWAEGKNLIDYEVLDPGEARDAFTIIKVKLTMADRADQHVTKDVGYLISTEPVLTMHRYMAQ